MRRSLCGNVMMVHPEDLVLAMLGNQNQEVRAEAVELVLAVRKCRRPDPVHTLRYPEINLVTDRCTELLNLQRLSGATNIESPFNVPRSDEELGKCLQKPLGTGVLCHSQ